MHPVVSVCAASVLGGILVACGGDRLGLGGGGDSKCVPGLYVGSYSCTLDGSSPLSPEGTVSIALQGDRGARSLAVGPGTTLTGTQSGTRFVIPLTGSLDCTSYTFDGTLGQINLTSAVGSATVYQTSPMTARYDGDASPPSLLDGVWTTSPNQAGLGQACGWSAQLQQ
jgi:hypothetical protein